MEINWTDRLKEAVVGGLTGLAIVTVYIIIRAVLTGASDGDWLSFAGAVTGTSLAVAGAVWIDHRRRSSERQAEAKAILAPIIRLRAIAEAMMKDRPHDIPEAEWQDAINQMPENLATYGRRLDRALDRLTSATIDFNVVEAGDMVLRAARRIERRFASGDANQASQIVNSLDLLKNSCDVAIALRY